VEIQCLECGEGLPFTGHEHGEKEKSRITKKKKEEIMKKQENNWSPCTSYQPRWMEISSLCSPYQPQSLLMAAVLKSFNVDFSPL